MQTTETNSVTNHLAGIRSKISQPFQFPSGFSHIRVCVITQRQYARFFSLAQGRHREAELREIKKLSLPHFPAFSPIPLSPPSHDMPYSLY